MTRVSCAFFIVDVVVTVPRYQIQSGGTVVQSRFIAGYCKVEVGRWAGPVGFFVRRAVAVDSLGFQPLVGVVQRFASGIERFR